MGGQGKQDNSRWKGGKEEEEVVPTLDWGAHISVCFFLGDRKLYLIHIQLI